MVSSARASVQGPAHAVAWGSDASEEPHSGPARAAAALLSAQLSSGNQLRVLKDGAQTLPAMFHAIRAARRYVHLEYYVIEDVHLRGESLFDLLSEKCRSGVQVAIIFDVVGSSGTHSQFFAGLRKQGVHLLGFNPVNPLRSYSSYSLNCRDHRKILIADGTTAIVGGINMSRAYETAQDQRRWRDTDLQVAGPAVAHLQRLFLDHWAAHGGASLPRRGFFPALVPRGQERVAIVGSSPQGQGPRFHDVLLAALRAARHRIWLTAGYFLPTPALMQELVRAASRQVDVRLLLPSHNDSVAALAVQRSSYARLLDAGVTVLERSAVILHSKSAVIDQAWSCVGTSNIDARSVRYNHEVDAIVLGTRTADGLGRLFLEDVSKARMIEPAAWKSRPVTQKLREAFWSPWQGLL
jgi:cardiolipin synthase A/B